MIYDTVYRSAVEFTLAQSFLSESQLQLIEQKALPKLYAKYRYNRHTVKAIQQGSREMGGASSVLISLIVGAGVITDFLGHIRTTQTIEEAKNPVNSNTMVLIPNRSIISSTIKKDISYAQGRFIPGVRN